MIDGPTAFIFLLALLTLAAVGAVGMIACVAALCTRRRRRLARSWLLFGLGGAMTALLLLVVVVAVGLDERDRLPSLFLEWGAITFPAGFAMGGAVRIAVRFRDLVRPV